VYEVAIFPDQGLVRFDPNRVPRIAIEVAAHVPKVKTQQKETYLCFVPQLRVHVLYTENNRYFWGDFQSIHSILRANTAYHISHTLVSALGTAYVRPRIPVRR
jgi:hypothetical protein